MIQYNPGVPVPTVRGADCVSWCEEERGIHLLGRLAGSLGRFTGRLGNRLNVSPAFPWASSIRRGTDGSGLSLSQNATLWARPRARVID